MLINGRVVISIAEDGKFASHFRSLAPLCRFLFLAVTFGFISVWNVYPQTQMTGDLAVYVNTYITNMPASNGTNEYQVPSSSQITIWGNAIIKILQNQYSAANDTAALIGYMLIAFTDNTTTPNKLYYVLVKTSSSTNHWGIFIYNPNALRSKIFIQSPHPKYDLNTGRQGFLIFKNIGANSFFLSGTHRCNSSLYSTCSGTSTVCSGDSENYRKSDQAHNTDGTLQKATEILRNNITNLVVVQVHGFAKDTDDPDVIMGNGTTLNPTGSDYLLMVKNNLAIIDPTLTFKVAHIDTGWTRLIGRTNTQGRLINGSSNPCNTNASSANGRFLHIEQAYTKLRDNQTNWAKLSNAIALTFPVLINLTSPNGGETWSGGSNQLITWTSSGDIANVKLEYSANNGKSWILINSNIPNTGAYNWSIPKVGTWRARVRVSAVYDSTINDNNDAQFTINFTNWPVSNSDTPDLIASPFGSRLLSGVYDFHRGIDLPNVLSTPIYPVRPGIVVRFEDTSQTIGTPRERYGNWILVQHRSESGVPRHTSYLHLKAFNNYKVGDTVSTLDTIAFMGKSGVGINTIHLHLEYYKNLSGTSIDKNKAFNPLEILNYNNSNSYLLYILKRNDSTGCQIVTSSTELDLDKIIIYGTLATKTVGFNQRLGIDPVNNDNPRYSGVFIDPSSFTKDSLNMRYRFWTKDVEVGTIDSFKIFDVKGFSTTFSTNLICKDIQIAQGWNIISVPTTLLDMSVKTLFPTATSYAYSYSNGYQSVDTLENSKAYWLKFASPQTLTICGEEIPLVTIPVSAGWNLIGAYDKDVEVVNITSIPIGIIQSNFYGYNASYFQATILESGKGYWLKLSESGFINLQVER